MLWIEKFSSNVDALDRREPNLNHTYVRESGRVGVEFRIIAASFYDPGFVFRT